MSSINEEIKKHKSNVKINGTDACELSVKLGYDLQEIGKIMTDFGLAVQAFQQEFNKSINAKRKALEKVLSEGEAADFFNDMSGITNKAAAEAARLSGIEDVLERSKQFKIRMAKSGVLKLDIERHLIIMAMGMIAAMEAEFSGDDFYPMMPFDEKAISKDATTLRQLKSKGDSDSCECFLDFIIKEILDELTK